MIRIFSTIGLTALAITAQAQEFGIELNAGMQGLHYKLNQASGKLQAGGSLGVNYNFPISSRWGLLTGISGGYYNTKTTLNNGSIISSFEVDDLGSAFRFDTKATGYKETNSFLAAGIPIMVQYQSCGKTQWYMNAGTKLLIPFNVKTKAIAQQLELSGYYPDYNLEVKDMPQHGFGTISNWSKEEKTELKPTATLSAATGFSFPVGEGLRLYTGLYIDYGLTDMRKDKDPDASLVVYNPNALNQSQVNGLINRGDNARLLGYGIQLRLGFTKKKSSPKPVAVVTPTPSVEPIKADPPAQPVIEQTIAPVQEKLPADTPAQPQQAPVITSREEEVVKQPVTFYLLGKTSVPEGLKPHLDSVANILQRYPDLHVDIMGHTCDIGTEKENEKIGLERARSVAAYLEMKGVAATRITKGTAGQSDPVVPNDSARNRSENRRVTITVK